MKKGVTVTFGLPLFICLLAVNIIMVLSVAILVRSTCPGAEDCQERVVVLPGGEWADGGEGGAADDGGEAEGPLCVPRLVSDDSRDVSVLTQMGDWAMDTTVNVSVQSGGFSLKAEAEVTRLTVHLDPPVLVEPGKPVKLPPLKWDRATVAPTGVIVCTVEDDGTCSASVRSGDPLKGWSDTDGAADIAVRVDYRNDRPDEVSVHFRVKSAIKGGGVTGQGLHKAPPPGFIRYGTSTNTVAPAVGHARWRCVWLL